MSDRQQSMSLQRSEKRQRRAESRPHSELLPRPTEEQLEILETIQRGFSFRVLANAGTGKTHTLLKAASRLRTSCLFLAYNKDIKEEVQDLAAGHRLSQLDVENYDSVLVNYYDKRAACQDFQLSLQRILEEDAPPHTRREWSAVFIDEAQDLDEHYVRFVQKILKDQDRKSVV